MTVPDIQSWGAEEAERPDGRVTILYGPHVVGRYQAQGVPLAPQASERHGRKANGFGGGLAFPQQGSHLSSPLLSSLTQFNFTGGIRCTFPIPRGNLN